MAKTSTAVYLYCIAQTARRPSLAGVPSGVPGATPVEPHRVAATLWLLSAAVPLSVYGPQMLEPRLRDLDWVAQVALAHEGVVEAFARRPSLVVVPAKLFTMFSSVDKAVQDVTGRRAAIERVMKRIAGCEEWGMRVLRQPPARQTPPAAPTSGSAFLTQRKAARDEVKMVRAQTAAAAVHAFTELSRFARDAKQRPRREEPGSNPPILEAAFLVTAKGRAAFAAEARRQSRACSAAGAELLVTGPWPAYNFIETAP